MKKSEWNEEQLKQLLSQMPKIKDERDPRDIYQNIEVKIKKRKRAVWIMPGAAAAAALLLLFILAPNLISWQESAENSIEDRADKSSSFSERDQGNNILMETEEAEPNAKKENSVLFDSSTDSESINQFSMKSAPVNDDTTAVYEEDLEGKEVLTYAIPDQNVMNMVPVSILVSAEHNKSKFELFRESMSKLTEEDWGLSEYYPLNAKLSFDQKTKILTVDVPEDHSYSMSSTTEKFFNQALSSAMYTLNIEKIKLTTNGQSGIHFSHYGHMEEFKPEERGNQAYYFHYPKGHNSKPFIVPFQEKFNSIEEAFAAMKKDIEEPNLQASIPSDMIFETEETPEKKLIIRFANESEVDDDKSTLLTIEAILLTAKDFKYKAVKLENADSKKIGKFNLGTELKVPVAANKRPLQ